MLSKRGLASVRAVSGTAGLGFPGLSAGRFSETTLKDKFVAFGQSYRSMSPALRDLEGKILDKKIRHCDHPVLTMNVANAVVETDALGNRRLAKKKAIGRIDGVSGLAMAIGAAPAAMTAAVDVAALIV
jgi:phage terminase large subunit-like protein